MRFVSVWDKKRFCNEKECLRDRKNKSIAKKNFENKNKENEIES